VISNRASALFMLAMIVAVGILTTSSLIAKPSAANTRPVTETVNEQDGLRFTMALQNNTFKVGEPVNITFTVTNIGSQTITYWRSEPEFDFKVYNLSNNNLYQWTLFKVFPMVIWSTSLNPGDNVTGVLVWPQTCNQTEHNNEGVPVSPGEYSIIGFFVKFRLQTSPLQVNIGQVNIGGDEPVQMIAEVGILGAGLAVPVLVLLAAAATKKR
jgi:hypothetical protein